jgi:hypothetical protein
MVILGLNENGANGEVSVAAAKGQVEIAEVIQELSPDIAEEFMDWFSER